jgi:hypothetical protein
MGPTPRSPSGTTCDSVSILMECDRARPATGWLFVTGADHQLAFARLLSVPFSGSGKPCTRIVVHSSGSDQDGIVLLPELDAKLAQRLGATE